MVRLVGKDVTGAFKAKAQSGALFREGSAVVPFFVGRGVIQRRKALKLRIVL